MASGSEGVLGAFVTNENRPFWEACARGELVAQRCQDCHRLWFPPSDACMWCLSPNYVWTALSGTGEVYSWVLMRRSPTAAYSAPYNAAVIELSEGIRMVSNVVGCRDEDIQVGMKVSVVFETTAEGVVLPRFKPAGTLETER